MSELLVPTVEEVRWWLLHVTQHVCHIEYFLHELGLGQHDPERPHDIIGLGNKFEWKVIRGFALEYRDHSPEFFERQIRPSLLIHRCQYHHQKWNEPNDASSPDDMKLGAVDAICSLLESRGYQGGSHSYEQILALAKKNPPHKQGWMVELVPEMEKLLSPRLDLIRSLDDIPNIGLPRATHDIIRQRVEETRTYLQRDMGYVV